MCIHMQLEVIKVAELTQVFIFVRIVRGLFATFKTSSGCKLFIFYFSISFFAVFMRLYKQ